MAMACIGRAAGRLLGSALVLLLFGGLAPAAFAGESIRLKVIGGLAGVAQFTRLEEPFWREEIRRLSGGRITATIQSFDRSGLPGPEMLQLMRLGVVPFGTALLAVVAADEPEFNALDLPALSPDIETLRRNVEAFRARAASLLRDRYGVTLLGIYTYPAQVIYCTRPFRGLDDLAGRRIRTSSVGQSELVSGLGALPVLTPFSETVKAVTNGVVDCAITGTLSGHEIGLSDVTTHLHGMAIGWGLSFFGANSAAWFSLPHEARDVIGRGVADLEDRIWVAAGQDTLTGFLCNIGTSSCPTGRRGRMTLVPTAEADRTTRERLLRDVVLPRWVDRCGPSCVESWNATLSAVTGHYLEIDGTARVHVTITSTQ
jgi:TRAP-type C4-dicarboxylate transport system substrate-binding protein